MGRRRTDLPSRIRHHPAAPKAVRTVRSRLARLDRALRHNPAGLYSLTLNPLDPAGRPLDHVISQGVLDIAGVGADALDGDPLEGWRHALHPEDRDRDLAAQADLMRHGHLSHEYRILRPDGGEVWVLDRMVLIRDGRGRPSEIIGAWLDITGRHAMEDELRRSNADLEQFAYAVSHDLQEPLRMVSAYLGLLQRRYGGALDAEADEFIRFATDGAQRMHRMIGDLLAYSRVNRMGAPFAAVALDDCLAVALANLRAAVADTGASVESPPEGLPTVWGDAAQLARLFQNLIGNAIKYARPGTPPRIRVTARPHRDGWQVAVADNGIGIDAMHFERIFQIFQRLHTRREADGTGIGLAICKRIAERHGGRIWVESVPDHGSTFHVTLQRPQAAATRQGSAVSGTRSSCDGASTDGTGNVPAR